MFEHLPSYRSVEVKQRWSVYLKGKKKHRYAMKLFYETFVLLATMLLPLELQVVKDMPSQI